MENKKNQYVRDFKKQEVPFDIPVEGSLGLLALGAVGIIAWKKKKLETNKGTTSGRFEKK